MGPVSSIQDVTIAMLRWLVNDDGPEVSAGVGSRIRSVKTGAA